MKPVKLLILGGSGEAADLARALAGDARYDVTLSLAGRAAMSVLPAVATATTCAPRARTSWMFETTFS